MFSGVSADNTINCDQSHAIGLSLQNKMVGHNFGEIKMKRNDKVTTLASLTSSVLVRGERVVVDQQQMLLRCMATIQTSADLEHFMKYEYVNYAPSLFDRFSMRKTVKSALTQSLNLDEHIKEGH